MLDLLLYVFLILYIFRKVPKFANIATIARFLLRIPRINRMFRQKIKPANYTIIEPEFFFKTMPLDGLDVTKCFEIVKSYSRLVRSNLKSTLHSGTIYVNISSNNEYQNLPQTIEGLYMYIMQQSYYWNNMHDVEFRPTYSIQRQLGWMVADILGGAKNPFTCMHTTGGTQSIMTAARAYTNYGMKIKGLKRNEVTIIALDTLHASLIKARDAYGFNLVIIPTTTGWNFPKDIRKAVENNKATTVAIFCSYPAYVYGKIDDINMFSKLATNYGIGLHIDCCLGGFVFNHLKGYADTILDTPGLTSLSIDPHKNGLAPKGSSLLYTFNFGRENRPLAYYSFYAISDWKGGLYGSIKDEGSASFVEVFCTYITLLHHGKTSYKQTAQKINDACSRIINDITHHCYHIVDTAPLNVICFKIHPTNNNVSYHFASQMEKAGIKLSILSDGYLQFCITPAFVSKEEHTDKFVEAFGKTILEMDKVDSTNSSVRLYSSVDIALDPPSINYKEYIENKLFGKMALEESIREHFLGLLNIEHTPRVTTPAHIESVDTI